MATLTLGENSYVDLATADGFIPNFFDTSAWSSLTDSEKEQALITASNLLDQQFAPFLSHAVSQTQSMAFPRKKFAYSDPVLGLFVQVEEDEFPPILQKAVMQLANHFAEHKQTLFGGESTIEWSNISLDSLSISRTPGQGPLGSKRVPVIPHSVATLIRPLTLYSDAGRHHWWRAN